MKNQIQLAYEGESEKIDELLNTSSSIDDIFRQAQKEYNIWSKLPAAERTTKELLNRLSFDFFEVLDSVTIARSRKHIEQYYDTADIGKFPTRLTPIPRRPDLTDLDSAINYNEIYEIVSRLNLAIYTPSDFILASRIEKYTDTEKGYLGLTMGGREKGIRRLMSINLLKRLESSVNSFRLTLQRIKSLISSTIEKLATIEQGENFELELEDISQNLDYDDREADMFIGGKKTKIALQDLDHIAWRKYLEEDLESLNLLLLMLADITPEHDSKLQQLVADLRHKFANPINKGNKKVIIFTAFSDTAEYLYDCLAEPIKQRHGLHTALVSGDVEARSTLRLPQREKLDFNKVLTLFSPISKEKATIYPHIHEEIDVLIATDCISEGQNLQDCDYLINYDIHWNPVRIIQRFGRIDRIGSRNSVIQLVNYWPNVTLDEYIDLKGRVEARMKVSVLTSTGDDNPISPEEKEGTYPLLNKSIDYLCSCPFVNLRSSHYVLFEYTEVRKYQLFISKSNKIESTSFKDKLHSFFCRKDKELDKDAIKAKIKRTWNRNSVDYNHIKVEINNKIQEELNFLRNDLNLDFDEHVLHKALVFPTNSLCLSTKISKEDCLVLVSCMHPKEDKKLEHCILLSRDDQYYKSYQNNINDVDLIFQASNLVLPQFIHTNKIKHHQNKQLNLYKNSSIDIAEVWNDIICTALKAKLSDSYIGETYSFGKTGIPAQCVYFDTKNPNFTLQESEGLLFISKDLTTKISIAGPFEYMNNGNKITLPHRNPQFTKYSFLPSSVTSDTLVKLRQKGNLVFYENY